MVDGTSLVNWYTNIAGSNPAVSSRYGLGDITKSNVYGRQADGTAEYEDKQLKYALWVETPNQTNKRKDL